jgi:hypothetical protein
MSKKKTMRPTIDDELAHKVRQAALDRGVTHRDLVNDAVAVHLAWLKRASKMRYQEFLTAAANLRREAS